LRSETGEKPLPPADAPLPDLAIACASGGFKGVFVHGVVSAFERAGVRVAAYAGASSSVVCAACGVTGLANSLGLTYWEGALDLARQPGTGMSEVVLGCIARWSHVLRPHFAWPRSPRLLIAASAVCTPDAAAQTQGPGARALGRRLLVQAARRDGAWAAAHLRLRLFDSASEDPALCLTAERFDAIAYASTRMLHAWNIPAWVEGEPCIDASYTCACPAIELAALGYTTVLAISPEPGPLCHDLFAAEPLPPRYGAARIQVIQPGADLRELGVDFTTATEAGLRAAYAHGDAQAQAFLDMAGLTAVSPRVGP
jgi:hypothetical protein